MPEIQIPLHELLARHKEIPAVDDCYLVGVWTNSIPEGDLGAVKEGVFPKTPFKADDFDPLVVARDQDIEEWEYQWGWNRKPGSSVRLGCNTPSVSHPVFLRFKWGEGAPKVVIDGIQILPHVKSFSHLCEYCSVEVSGIQSECRGRRLIALADAVRDNNQNLIQEHLKAIDLWHRETRTERFRRWQQKDSDGRR